MTQAITTSSSVSTAVTTTKAFYQITQVAVSGATGTTLTVGTSDTLGLPVRVIDAGYVISVGWNNTLARDTGTLTVAATATATSTTGDVRGTYAVGTSNGSKRLVMSIAMPAIAVGPNATRVGALGVTQA